jgi:hypothetical protein
MLCTASRENCILQQCPYPDAHTHFRFRVTSRLICSALAGRALRAGVGSDFALGAAGGCAGFPAASVVICSAVSSNCWRCSFSRRLAAKPFRGACNVRQRRVLFSGLQKRSAPTQANGHAVRFAAAIPPGCQQSPSQAPGRPARPALLSGSLLSSMKAMDGNWKRLCWTHLSAG